MANLVDFERYALGNFLGRDSESKNFISVEIVSIHASSLTKNNRVNILCKLCKFFSHVKGENFIKALRPKTLETLRGGTCSPLSGGAC